MEDVFVRMVKIKVYKSHKSCQNCWVMKSAKVLLLVIKQNPTFLFYWEFWSRLYPSSSLECTWKPGRSDFVDLNMYIFWFCFNAAPLIQNLGWGSPLLFWQLGIPAWRDDGRSNEIFPKALAPSMGFPENSHPGQINPRQFPPRTIPNFLRGNYYQWEFFWGNCKGKLCRGQPMGNCRRELSDGRGVSGHNLSSSTFNKDRQL